MTFYCLHPMKRCHLCRLAGRARGAIEAALDALTLGSRRPNVEQAELYEVRVESKFIVL